MSEQLVYKFVGNDAIQPCPETLDQMPEPSVDMGTEIVQPPRYFLLYVCMYDCV